MRNLGGADVAPDPATAAQWLEKSRSRPRTAVSRRRRRGEARAGTPLRRSDGVERDVVRALRLYGEARAGNDEARQNFRSIEEAPGPALSRPSIACHVARSNQPLLVETGALFENEYDALP